MFSPPVIASVVALVASISAAVISIWGKRSYTRLEQKIARERESAEFIAEKLTKFYLPMLMHLASTKKLFDRFLKAESDERSAIEHELRGHNGTIRETLMKSSIHLEKDAPEDMVERLLEHLIQWEIVYKLKYIYKVYDGPVFAGIEKFGFCDFPTDLRLDQYFKRKVEELRGRYHERLE